VDERLVGYPWLGNYPPATLLYALELPHTARRVLKIPTYPLFFWIKNRNVRMDTTVSEWERLKFVIMREKYSIRSGLALDSS